MMLDGTISTEKDTRNCETTTRTLFCGKAIRMDANNY